MAVFTILEAPAGNGDRTVFVREGFAFWALVFTALWALWHRMWVVAAVLFALLASLNIAVSAWGFDAALASAAGIAIGLVFGFEARRLRVLSLERAGYRIAGLLQASSLEAAELQYFTDRAAAPDRPLPPYRPHTDDMLNLFGNV